MCQMYRHHPRLKTDESHTIPSRREVVLTDASLTGWGAEWQHRIARGNWKPEQT